MSQRSFARVGFPPPHSRRDTSLFQNLNESNLARGSGVSAAAKFRRKVTDLNHSYAVAILLAKQSHGVILVNRDVNGHVLDDFDSLITQDFLINEVLNLLQFFALNRCEMRKVEAQMVRRNQRSRLLHMVTQNFAQPGLQQMR